MKKLKYILHMFMISLFITSCFKDLGNYDYTYIPDFEITGLKEKYSVVSYTENMNIQVVVESEDKNAEFEYEWGVVLQENEMVLDSPTYLEIISNEKDLSIPFEYKSGTYTLQLKVTNKSTGLAKLVSTQIEAVTPFSKGYYLLKETSDGNTDMDIFYDNNTSSINAIAEFKGTSLQGKPKSLSYLPEISFLDEEIGSRVIDYLIIPASEKEIVTFSLTDMTEARTYAQWFFGEPYSIEKAHYFTIGGAFYGLFTDDGVFTNYQAVCFGMTSSGKFPELTTRAYDNKEYEISFPVCHSEIYSLMFDSKNGRFLLLDFNAGVQEPDLSESDEKVKYPITDRLVFMGESKTGDNYTTIIFEREDGSRYYYYANTTGASNNSINIMEMKEIDPSLKFAEATRISPCRKDGRYLYFLSDGEIYTFNPVDGTESKLDVPFLPEGNITYMDTMYSSLESEGPDSFNHLIIAVENAGKYTVCFYNMVGGIPVAGQEPVLKLEGDGKVTSIQRATPLKTSGFISGWSIHY